MSNLTRLLGLISLLLAYNPAFCQVNNDYPKEVKLVFDYMTNKDFPESFNNVSHQFRPVAWVINDMDNDGTLEVFLQTFPHYRQSPTISLFQINKSGSVSRITEGLAPGHLIPVSDVDNYIDPHTTGTAIDAQLGGSNPEKDKIFAASVIKHGLSPVLYKNFIHTDKRDGGPTLLDLRYLDDFKEENTCENFQFPQPESIAAGKIPGKANKFFIAQVDNKLFCYEILGFKADGWINKIVTIIDKPNDFKRLKQEAGFIKYETLKGDLRSVKL
jgi:hypothetical protein